MSYSPKRPRSGCQESGRPIVSGLDIHLKGGSYDICYGSCAGDDVITRDYAGQLTLPIQTPGRPTNQAFVWGSFIANETTSCPAFPCGAANLANTAVAAALPELFRPAIRSALQTWAAKTSLHASLGHLKNRKLAVGAQLITTFGRKRPQGMTVTFSAAGRTICSAKTNNAGSAHCTGTLRRRVKTYTARFAGTDGLFPVNAVAAIVGR